jgi:hypothetical protein
MAIFADFGVGRKFKSSKYVHIFLRLKFSSALNSTKISHPWMDTIYYLAPMSAPPDPVPITSLPEAGTSSLQDKVIA